MLNLSHPKKLIIILPLFILLTSSFLITGLPPSYAHSYLSNSNPSSGQILTENIERIELFFDTKIEKLSTFTIKNEMKQEMMLEELHVTEHEMIGQLQQPLPRGIYTVYWIAVGVDGHPVKGNFTFEIKADLPDKENESTQNPITNQPEKKSEENNITTEKDITTENGNSSKNNFASPTETQTKAYSNPIIVIIIIIIIILFIIIYLYKWRSRRRRNK